MRTVTICVLIALARVALGDALAIYPPDIELRSAVARQAVIVVLTHVDGVTEDVTAKATLKFSDARPARLEGCTLVPQADGNTELAAAYQGLTATISVAVKDAQAARPVSFRRDVMPVLMRAGCNTGACHGSARGQDGFHISLFGYDPDGDHYHLTREIPNRRINLAVPEESLLLEKAIGTVQHTGGKRFGIQSAYYRTLLEWIQAGTPLDPGDGPRVVGVEMFPPQMVLEGSGVRQPLVVRARYSDGSQREVTGLAVFLTNNDNSAAITPDGLVTSAAPGEAFVMARFNTFTVGSQVLVLAAGVKYAPPAESPVNYIDELVGAKLRKLRIAPAPLCTDAVFLRRVALDITGRLPTAEEYAAFLADPATDKRAKLIDRLLARPEFAKIWAMQWAELLMVRSSIDFSPKSAFLYNTWLEQQIESNVPIDRMVRELLGASGGTFRNPATNFYQVERDTLKTSENVVQTFLGIRVQCAQCHNHPFDRWTMDDYYAFAAFFAQIGRKPAEDYRETIVFDRGGGEQRHLVGGRVMPPKFLGGDVPDCKGRDRRAVLADWLTAPDNPYFSKSLANRVWAHFFGIGIVEPVDDFRVSNPASNPELLATLGRKLVEYGWDFKRLVRDVCNAHAYQRSTQSGADLAAERNFAVAHVRRLRAEILLDCITQVTETKDKFRGLPLGARAVEIADGATTNYFLTTFGRSPRETVCACDVRTEPTLSQALHLLNGETVEQKIRGGGLINRLLYQEKLKPEEIIRQLYIRSVTREPDPAERDRLMALASKPGKADNGMAQGLQDVFWALLNSREFVFNH